jgi:catechol 2,3-dioxygenase-like lactoylglutathione lyase family enzyme
VSDEHALDLHNWMQDMSDQATMAAFSHIGVCVSDIERSRRFYIEALGFTVGPMYEMEDTINDLLGIPIKVRMTSLMLQKGHQVIELIYFREPKPFAVGGLRPMNQLGLTHLSFTAQDVDALAARLEQFGGKLLRETRTVIDMPGSDPAILLFCTDPDGTRIELYKPSGAPVQ